MRVLEPCRALQNTSYINKNALKVLVKPDSNKVGVGKNHKFKTSDIAVRDKAEELEMYCRGRVDNPMQCSQMEMDVNQVTQSTPDSPPFCDTKGSDNDCSDQDSEHVRKLTLIHALLCNIYLLF